MPGVFDKLTAKLDEQAEDGLSPIQIAALPPLERRIVKMLLRELEMTHEGLWGEMQSLPEADRPTREGMEAALDNLAGEGWVIRMGEGDHRHYEPNMRRKAPSVLSKAIWAALGSKITESKAAQQSEQDTSQ